MYYILILEVTRGYRGLQMVLGGYRGLQGVARGYMGLQKTFFLIRSPQVLFAGPLFIKIKVEYSLNF